MASAFRFGRFELRPAQRALLLDGAPVHLVGRAFDLLVALVERRDRVVVADELLDLVWTGLAVEVNNLSVQVSRLRKCVGSQTITAGYGPKGKRGYRFSAPVTEVPLPGDGASGAVQQLARRGAVLCIQLAGSGDASAPGAGQGAAGAVLRELEAVVPDRIAGRIVSRGPDHLCIALERAADSARMALKAQRQVHAPDHSSPLVLPQRMLQIGIAAADDGVQPPSSDGASGAAQLALALALSAGVNEIIVTADIVGEFVAGIDGDVEDLGDLTVAADKVRVYRVRPAREWAAPAAPATLAIAPAAAATAAEPMAAAATALRPGIAVLPFDGLVSADPDDMLGEALADDVITFLSRSPEFNVISGLSSRRLKRCGLSAGHMAGCLHAAYLLTGSYRLASGRLLLNVHLQDARRGTVIRSLHLEATLQDAFDPTVPLGHRVGQEVAQTLFSHALQQSIARPLPELESYALLLGAIGLMHRAAPKEFERARAMLDHLAQRAGCGGVAAAWLAKWHVLRVVQGWSPDPSADSERALDHVARSLDEDSRDALALAIGGLVHAYLRKDLRTAGRLYEAAIDANPSEPLAWLFTAIRHAYLGRGSDAEAAGERALRLSPIDPMKYFFDSLAASAALSNASWDRSVALSLRSLKANRTHASTWRTLAFALVMLDRMDEARDAVQRLLEIEPGYTVGRFWERFPGRDGPLAAPWAEALKAAGLPA